MPLGDGGCLGEVGGILCSGLSRGSSLSCRGSYKSCSELAAQGRAWQSRRLERQEGLDQGEPFCAEELSGSSHRGPQFPADCLSAPNPGSLPCRVEPGPASACLSQQIQCKALPVEGAGGSTGAGALPGSQAFVASCS